jgi:hypothetical protein
MYARALGENFRILSFVKTLSRRMHFLTSDMHWALPFIANRSDPHFGLGMGPLAFDALSRHFILELWSKQDSQTELASKVIAMLFPLPESLYTFSLEVRARMTGSTL